MRRARDSGSLEGASRTGDCVLRFGLVELDGTTGNDTEKRFVRAGAVAAAKAESIASVDNGLLCRCELCGREVFVGVVGLLGRAMCSGGLGFADIEPER